MSNAGRVRPEPLDGSPRTTPYKWDTLLLESPCQLGSQLVFPDEEPKDRRNVDHEWTFEEASYGDGDSVENKNAKAITDLSGVDETKHIAKAAEVETPSKKNTGDTEQSISMAYPSGRDLHPNAVKINQSRKVSLLSPTTIALITSQTLSEDLETDYDTEWASTADEEEMQEGPTEHKLIDSDHYEQDELDEHVAAADERHRHGDFVKESPGELGNVEQHEPSVQIQSVKEASNRKEDPSESAVSQTVFSKLFAGMKEEDLEVEQYSEQGKKDPAPYPWSKSSQYAKKKAEFHTKTATLPILDTTTEFHLKTAKRPIVEKKPAPKMQCLEKNDTKLLTVKPGLSSETTEVSTTSNESLTSDDNEKVKRPSRKPRLLAKVRQLQAVMKDLKKAGKGNARKNEKANVRQRMTDDPQLRNDFQRLYSVLEDIVQSDEMHSSFSETDDDRATDDDYSVESSDSNAVGDFWKFEGTKLFASLPDSGSMPFLGELLKFYKEWEAEAHNQSCVALSPTLSFEAPKRKKEQQRGPSDLVEFIADELGITISSDTLESADSDSSSVDDEESLNTQIDKTISFHSKHH